MGETTEIAWCDSTFNPWIGCQKVSAGCDNCYAETLMDTRYHRVEWGQRKTDDIEPSVGTRVRTSATNWRNPITWNKHHAAFHAQHGHRQRVFCSSLADVFDNQVEPQWRIDLFNLIWDTPNLDWLLLTKRPENIVKMLPPTFRRELIEWPNVWLGTTCEDQTAYNRRWPILRAIPAAVRFVSYEPAIGPLRLLYIPGADSYHDRAAHPNWIICGGESGPGARYMSPTWAADIKRDCEDRDISFFMKQMTGKKPIPEDLMVRQFPASVTSAEHGVGA